MEKFVLEWSVSYLKKNLPKKCVLLFLSHTGSRVFGWGYDKLDFDLHGAFYCYGEDWFDWVHVGRNMTDLNVWDLEHVAYYARQQSLEMFMNYATPIYVDENFDYDGMMALLDPIEGAVRYKQSALYQYGRLVANWSPRVALHTYRTILVPMYLLRTGKLEVNVVELAKREFDTVYPAMLANAYAERRTAVELKEPVMAEIKRLLDEYVKEADKYKPNWNCCNEKVYEWKKRVKSVYDKILCGGCD